MSENARAHLARRLAEAEYFDERDSRRPEHNEPGISCNILKAETGLLGDLPPDVAVEIDTAADDISRIEHAGRKVDAAGTGGMGIHHAQQERAIAGQQRPHPETRADVPVGKAPVAPSDETCVISLEHSALQRGAGNLKIPQQQDTPVPQLGFFAP